MAFGTDQVDRSAFAFEPAPAAGIRVLSSGGKVYWRGVQLVSARLAAVQPTD